MDANGTRHHLLLGAADWTSTPDGHGLDDHLSYDDERHELTLRPRPFRFHAGNGDDAPRLADRRGADVDRFGNVYWVAQAAEAVWVESAGSGTASVFWAPGIDRGAQVGHQRRPAAGGFAAIADPPSSGALRRLRLAGLAVTADHYLVVGTLNPAGLLVFDLHSPAPPRHQLWPVGVALVPFDMCARDGGGVFVLDRENRRIWELDRTLRVVSRGAATPTGVQPDFGPADPTGRIAGPVVQARVDDGDALDVVGDPIAIAAAGARILVLDQGLAAGVSAVRLLTEGTPAARGQAVTLEDRQPGGTDYRVLAHDMVLTPCAAPRPAAGRAAAVVAMAVPGSGSPPEPALRLGTLHVADSAGNQAYAFTLTLVGNQLQAVPEPAYFPMRLFGGKALIVGPAGPMYDFGSRWVPLVRASRPQFDTAASHHPKVFDATARGTVWHRLMLEAAIPPGTSVHIESRAAEDPDDLPAVPWQREPGLGYRRTAGSEQPFRAPEPGYDTFEILFQGAVGRYLQLRLTLTGDGRRTPRLRALRAYYPRLSYPVAYLPKVYREDPVSASFLERYLANAEGITTALEDRIASAQALFDPRTCPAEALEWLLGWFAVTSDPSWDDDRRRLFLKHAMRFFALRGTVAGLKCTLRLALDQCVDERIFDETGAGGPIRIVERFQARSVPAVAAGDLSEPPVPRLVPISDRWDPSQGADVLRRRWREALGDDGAEFPLGEAGPAWREFWRRLVGTETPGPPDPGRWRAFLASRYRGIEDLNSAYGLIGPARYASFADVDVPASLPPDGLPLRDWYHFVTVVQPAARSAHRFTVLLAVDGSNLDLDVSQDRRAVVRRIVELQKPAHTNFDVKFFWAAFRVGEARLGLDTAVGLGSRDPQFHRPLVLGQGFAGDAGLGGARAPVLDRVGRDPLNS